MPLDDSEGVEGDEGFSTLSNPSLFLLPALPDVYVLGVVNIVITIPVSSII